MGLLKYVAAETLKSAGEGMTRTLREQANESREKALLKARQDHEKAMASDAVDAKKGLLELEQTGRAKENALNRASNERIANTRAEAAASEGELNRQNRLAIAQAGQYVDEPVSDPSMAANDYAAQRVKEIAGYLSTDATDFAKWGGDRNAAFEFFRQQYLNEQTQSQGANSDPLKALQSKFGTR